MGRADSFVAEALMTFLLCSFAVRISAARQPRLVKADGGLRQEG
jgi:hypothetical protein